MPRALPFADASFDMVMISPTYGNRMGDHHNAKDASRRIGHTHTLGRTLTPGNSGAVHWEEDYRLLHRLSWEEVERVLRTDGSLSSMCPTISVRERRCLLSNGIGTFY